MWFIHFHKDFLHTFFKDSTFLLLLHLQHIAVVETQERDGKNQKALGTSTFASIMRDQFPQSCECVFGVLFEVLKLMKKNKPHITRVWIKVGFLKFKEKLEN